MCDEGPVLVRGVIWHAVFWVMIIVYGTASHEFWTVPILAGVTVIVTGDIVEFSFNTASVCAVGPSASSTFFSFNLTFCSEVSPAPAFHALHWFILLSLWSYLCNA